MSILLLGIDHQHASLATLERLAVPSDDTRKVCRELASLDQVLEAAVISTCNRMEVVVDLARFHDGYDAVVTWMADRAQLDRATLEPLLVAQVDEHAAAHLFSVAGGLDSMVVGEQQIAMQVKAAMEEAREEGTAGRMLQRLFRQAVRVGRRVRRETAIGAGASSMVEVGLDAAARRLGAPVQAGPVLVVGAGEVGSLTVQRLAAAGATDVSVHNRSRDKAERLAAKVDGHVVDEDGLAEALGAVDLVVCTTGASSPVITRELVEAGVARRGARPLVLLDLAVPRNVAPDAAELPGVTIVDVAAVREAADRGVTGEVLAEARELIAEEVLDFRAWLRQIEVEPTVRALRARAESVRAGELARLSGRLSSLDDDQRQAVEALTTGIINTLLHEPTVRLKRLADSGAERHASVLAELFALDPSAPSTTDPDPVVDRIDSADSEDR